eukprot:TRINITY_DN2036_c0_g1_i1.p1 TRINITY_DN2036_c0_g1~~TRINITY_DN2036_c0_g1_i1.p1  ORF type:complete len:211 (+),score=19.71 TRINITY_DN2036_c0_g1_i1:42-635(+)
MSERIPCERAADIVRALRRTERLPPYDNEGVLAVCQEITALEDEILGTIDRTSREERERREIRASIIVHNAYMHRNKRCMLVYLMHRLNKIKDLRWDLGGAVLPTEVRDSMSASEVEWFQGYDKLLAEYMGAIDLDLTVDLDRPPKDLFVEVRVLKEQGEIMLESGQAVNLIAHTTHYLRRTDVETLVRQGILAHIV